MLRPITNNLQTALTSPILRPAIFFSAQFVSGYVYAWSGVGTITWNSQTWLGVGTLGSVTTIEEGTDVQARNVTIGLSGLDATMVQDVLSEYQVGNPCSLWLGLFDVSGNLLPEPAMAFTGYMDQPTLTVGGDTSSISIACENRLLDMNVNVSRRLTMEDQQIAHPGDMCFSMVNDLQSIVLYWGSKPTSTNNQ